LNGNPRRGAFPCLAVNCIIAILIAFVSIRLCADVPGEPGQAATTPSVMPIADVRASQTHLFRYVPEAGKQVAHVSLAGDFNGWSATATEMSRVGDAYETTVALPEGVHYYKFVADGQWLNDPQSQADLEVSDNYGGKNSAVLIGLDARKLPAPVGDRIDAAAIAYDSSDVRDCNVVSDSMMRVSIRAQAGDVLEASILLQSAAGWVEAPLARTETQMGFDRFGGVITLTSPPGTTLHYVFKLSKPGAHVYVASSKAFNSESAAEATPYETVMHTDFQTPEWAQHAIWYQIFPERFRNGDPSNDPPDTQKWTSKWFDTHPGETGKFYNDVWSRRYGGDFQGIKQELPYLRSLGINAIYLNPIFQAWDMHKYDTTDYRHVDEHFGVKGDIEALQGETDDPATWQWTASDKVFLDFLAEAHRQGFKVIIDGVFNHVGTRFWAFQDVVKNGKDSKYASWFDITDWTPSENAPFHYHAWDKDNGSLPALKKDPELGIAHGPREHIMAITRRWLAPDGDPSKGVDGFRLDAPEGITHPFWADFRKLVKSIKPDAYIDGEIWGGAQPWLQGDQYDAVMNYQFAMASQQFFVNQKTAISCSDLNRRANQLIFNYPFQAALANQNLFDSHDTDRMASMFVNPDLPFDGANRIQDNGPHYNPAKPNAEQRQRMLQEVAWQMTFVGAPMIYYGDENGMWSPDDPSDRQPMVWKDLQPYDDPEVKFDQEKFEWYRRLIAVRKHFPALQTGFFRPVRIDDAHGIYVFSRDLGSQHVYVVLNHTGHPQSVEFTPTEKASAFINWLDPTASNLVEPTEPEITRPDISVADHAHHIEANNHTLSVPMQAWGAAVVTSAP
jgi:cyclomaltodextrinase